MWTARWESKAMFRLARLMQEGMVDKVKKTKPVQYRSAILSDRLV